MTKSPYERLLDAQSALFHELTSHQKGESDIRFGRSWVAASSIAEQFYCEHKVELRQQLGDIDTEIKRRGSEGHEALASEALETTQEDLFQHIFSDKLTIAQEMLVASHYKGLILVGQPDTIIFHQGRALLLFEFKFSRSHTPYHSYHVQANVYGKILEGMGFDVSDLEYVIAIIPPSSRNEPVLFTKIIQAVLEQGSTGASFEVDVSSVHMYAYPSQYAEEDIDWALEYWQKQRAAQPTQNPNKCARCEYAASCTMNCSPGITKG